MDRIGILNTIFKWKIDNNGCWIIISHKPEAQGYFPISFKGIRTRAHRLVYTIIKGDIENDMVIRHSCDNPGCINPDHLLKGTKKNNTQDMLKRNRQSDWKDRHGKKQKLTDKQICNIYTSNKTSYELSKRYCVSDIQIRRIKNGSRCKKIISKYLNGGGYA